MCKIYDGGDSTIQSLPVYHISTVFYKPRSYSLSFSVIVPSKSVKKMHFGFDLSVSGYGMTGRK